jgi:hypothetical protein
MPSIYVDVDLGDLYDDLSRFEKNDLVEYLREDGYISNSPTESSADQMSVIDVTMWETLQTIYSKYTVGRLSDTDITTLDVIANRF